MNMLSKMGAGLGLALVSGLALATPPAVDVTAATAAFDGAATAIGSVGAVMVVAAAAGIIYRWVTAFLVS